MYPAIIDRDLDTLLDAVGKALEQVDNAEPLAGLQAVYTEITGRLSHDPGPNAVEHIQSGRTDRT